MEGVSGKTMRRFATILAAGLAIGCGDNEVTPTPPIPGPTTITFASQIGAGGTAWRSIETVRTGEVKVQLVVVSPEDQASVVLGLGTFDGTNCTLFNSVNTVAGQEPQITLALSAGQYCVQVQDTGALTKVNVFQISVTIP
jgi:hypothetical protein